MAVYGCESDKGGPGEHAAYANYRHEYKYARQRKAICGGFAYVKVLNRGIIWHGAHLAGVDRTPEKAN